MDAEHDSYLPQNCHQINQKPTLDRLVVKKDSFCKNWHHGQNGKNHIGNKLKIEEYEIGGNFLTHQSYILCLVDFCRQKSLNHAVQTLVVKAKLYQARPFVAGEDKDDSSDQKDLIDGFGMWINILCQLEIGRPSILKIRLTHIPSLFSSKQEKSWKKDTTQHC